MTDDLERELDKSLDHILSNYGPSKYGGGSKLESRKMSNSINNLPSVNSGFMVRSQINLK